MTLMLAMLVSKRLKFETLLYIVFSPTLLLAPAAVIDVWVTGHAPFVVKVHTAISITSTWCSASWANNHYSSRHNGSVVLTEDTGLHWDTALALHAAVLAISRSTSTFQLRKTTPSDMKCQSSCICTSNIFPHLTRHHQHLICIWKKQILPTAWQLRASIPPSTLAKNLKTK